MATVFGDSGSAVGSSPQILPHGITRAIQLPAALTTMFIYGRVTPAAARMRTAQASGISVVGGSITSRR